MAVLTIWRRASVLKRIAIGMVVIGTALVIGIWSDALEPRHETSTIVGNVTSNQIAMHWPQGTDRHHPLTAISSSASPASPKLGTVQVRINGMVTETDDDGVFALGDVAPGQITMVFATVDLVYSLALTVPAGSTIFLHDIMLLATDGQAHPSRIEIRGKQPAAHPDHDGAAEDSAGFAQRRLLTL